MIKLFRNFRQSLLNEGKTSKYLKYAIGEIILVVIGILIALQINNLNEVRKEKAKMITNIHSIAEDIVVDALELERISRILKEQGIAGKNLIRIMESKNIVIDDSLKFILEFNSFTTVTSLSNRSNTWNYLNSSGIMSEFPDHTLLKMLKNITRHIILSMEDWLVLLLPHD